MFTKERSIRLQDVNDLYVFDTGRIDDIAMLVTVAKSDLAVMPRRYRHMSCAKIA